MVVGTARYLAPEQVDGRAGRRARRHLLARPRALRDARAASAPFEADTDIATAVARLTAPPQPDQPRVPGGAARARARHRPRARASDPADRWPSALAFRDALGAVPHRRPPGAGRPDHPGPAPAPARRGRPDRPDHRGRPGGRGRRRRPRPRPRRPAPSPRPACVLWAVGLRDRRARRATSATGRVDDEPVSNAASPPTTVAGAAADRRAPATTTPRATRPRTPTRSALIVDGNVATFWSTEQYQDRDVGGLKPGVGLVFDLGAPKHVDRVEVDSPGQRLERAGLHERHGAARRSPGGARRRSSAPGSARTRSSRCSRRPERATCCSGSRTCRRAARTACAWPRSASLAPPDPLRSRDDATLAGLAAVGDRDALEVLLDRHVDRVHAICRRMLGNPEDALDASQEALIAIARAHPPLRRARRVHHLAVPRRDQRGDRRAAAAAAPADPDARARDRLAEPPPPAPAPGPRRSATGSTSTPRWPGSPRNSGSPSCCATSATSTTPRSPTCSTIPPGTVRSRIARGRAALAVELDPGGPILREPGRPERSSNGAPTMTHLPAAPSRPPFGDDTDEALSALLDGELGAFADRPRHHRGRGARPARGRGRSSTPRSRRARSRCAPRCAAPVPPLDDLTRRRLVRNARRRAPGRRVDTVAARRGRGQRIVAVAAAAVDHRARRHRVAISLDRRRRAATTERRATAAGRGRGRRPSALRGDLGDLGDVTDPAALRALLDRREPTHAEPTPRRARRRGHRRRRRRRAVGRSGLRSRRPVGPARPAATRSTPQACAAQLAGTATGAVLRDRDVPGPTGHDRRRRPRAGGRSCSSSRAATAPTSSPPISR